MCIHNPAITCVQCPPRQTARATPVWLPIALQHDPALLADARDWIADCEWADDTSALTDTQVARGIERHYAGGWRQFIADSK